MFSSVSGSSVRKGISGLASGMDTDTLVEGMTSGTQSKIDKKNQEKQYISWKKDAYRTVAQGLMEFNDKYFSYGSSSTILSANFFKAYTINNPSDKVKVSGKIENAKNVQIDKIAALASKSRYSYSNSAIKGNLSGDITYEQGIDSLAGQSVSVTVDNKSYLLTFDKDFGKGMENASTEEKQQAIAAHLQTKIDKNSALKGHLTVEANGGKLSFTTDKKDNKGNAASLAVNANDNTLSWLGFSKTISGEDGTVTGDNEIKTKMDLKEQLTGQNITLSLNGISKTITFDEDAISGDDEASQIESLKTFLQKELDKNFGVGKVKISTAAADATKLKFEVADKSSTFQVVSGDAGVWGENGALGIDLGSSNKINNNMTLNDFGLDLLTTKYQKAKINYSDLLETVLKNDIKRKVDGQEITIAKGTTLEEAERQLGSGFSDSEKSKLFHDVTKDSFELKLDNDTTVTVEQGTTLGDMQTAVSAKGVNLFISEKDGEKSLILVAEDIEGKVFVEGTSSISIGGKEVANCIDKESGLYELEINDTKIMIGGEDTFAKIKDKINGSDAGVIFSYSSLTNAFVLESKETGAHTKIEFSAASKEAKSLGALMFGSNIAPDNPAIADRPKVQAGTDSEVTLTVNGVQETITRSTNNINVDGLIIELMGETEATDTAPIKFDVTNDVDSVIKNIKDFVESYNAILSVITSVTTEKPDKDYPPLTDAEKEALSEDQIKKWETEAKKGVLYNDPTLRKIADDLRASLYASVDGQKITMSEIGITTGGWAEKGKLEINETKLRDALLNRGDEVAALFTQASEIDYSSTLSSADRSVRYKESGLMNRFGDILKGAVSSTTTPKGSLLQIAGIANNRTDTDNKLYDQMKDLDEDIVTLTRRLQTERTRYYNQFTAMEKYINQMNQQSSYITQMLG